MRAFLRGVASGILCVYATFICWPLFGIGHIAWLVIDRLDRNDDQDAGPLFRLGFRVYQKTMGWSFVVQEAAELGIHCPWLPWGPPSKDA